MGVFSELKPKNSARKNPFPLGCEVTYNQKAGMIVPLKYWPTLPDSEYSLDLKALLRTQPLATAAFAGFSINYDVVWTPYNDHYSSFNQFIAQRLNKQHTTQPGINDIPSFDIGRFVRLLMPLCLYDSLVADAGRAVYDRFYINHPGIMCPWYLGYSENLPEESIFLSCLRTLDMLEYGNYLGLLKQIKNAVKDYLDSKVTYTVGTDRSYPYYVRFCGLIKDSVSAGDLATTLSSMANLSMSSYNLADFMVDIYDFIFDVMGGSTHPMLEYDYGILFESIVPIGNYVDLWPIQTYNKAFWQFYRNEYYDEEFKIFTLTTNNKYSSSNVPYVNLFNYDDFTVPLDPTHVVWNSVNERLVSMFAVKPHQYKKDLFTGLLPSTQYGSVSFATTTSNEWFKLIANKLPEPNSSYLSNPDNYLLNLGNSASNPDNIYTGIKANSFNKYVASDQFKTDPAIMISMLELRRADSLQRFRERMLRAGNKTKDIFQAHGWEEPMSEKAYDVQFFGTFDGRLDLNVVAATADTGNVNLGQLAANGVGAIGGSKIRFKSHDFGTLMILAYITKDASYDAYGINKSHMLLEPFDFPYPELQNVSLSPIVQKQLLAFGGSQQNAVLGFLPQNMAYKTANDLVHGEFFSANVLQPNGQELIPYPAGIFSNMVTPRQDINVAKQLSFFYIQPSCADNIFVVNANANQDTDQFFGKVRIELNAVQPLDVIGLPI